MPLLLPLLSRYWKSLLAGGLILLVCLYILLLRHELADCHLHVAMFEAVQKRNEGAITAQNRAIKKMWLRERTVEERVNKAQVVAGKILTKAVVESRKPVRFSEL